ncbi:MAG: hypothetical protein GXO39_05780 [Thermotogae bacterium]|nr:hypothetical protein [Thermotogota bacterium]
MRRCKRPWRSSTKIWPSEFIELLPYVENYLWPLAEESVNLVYGTEVSAEELEPFVNMSYRDFQMLLNMGFGAPVKFGEFLTLVKNSLQFEVLGLIILLLLEDGIKLKASAIAETKELFKTMVQKYYVEFRSILGQRRKVSFSWSWEGSIPEDSSSVDVQHEIYRWRLENKSSQFSILLS